MNIYTMNEIKHSLRVMLGLGAIVCLTIGLLVTWEADPYHLKAPKDEKLITLFHQHQASLEKLAQMAAEDQRKGLYYPVNPSAEKNMSSSRRQEYKTLLSKIGPDVDFSGEFDGASFIFAKGRGIRWFKGIAYSAHDDGKDRTILKDLNHLNKLPEGVFYRPIEPNWSIYYELNAE